MPLSQSSLLRLDLDAFARASGWMKRRSSKITPIHFVSAMVAAAGLSDASFRIVAFLSGTFSSKSVSAQALHQRVDANALGFLEAVLAAVISLKSQSVRPEGKFGFERIIVQDSTSIGLPRRLAGAFEGSRNASGDNAGLKIHASFDILGEGFTSFQIREQRRADQSHARDGVEGLGEKDLLIRDLGYFCIDAFRRLEGERGHVLSRWQPKVRLADPQTSDTIDLAALLSRRGRVDRDVLVGGRERFPMRLVAFRVPEEVAAKRRRRVRRDSKRKGRTPSRELLAFQDWQIYLTTCSRDVLAFDALFELYSQRWTVEMLFKAFKSHMKIDRLPARASEAMIRCLVLCSLIRIALTASVTRPSLPRSSGEGGGASPLKLHSLVAVLGFAPEASFFEDPANLENFERHCRYEKRKRKNLSQRLDSLA